MADKRIYSVDVSDGHEIIHTYYHRQFTQNQLAAIKYICENAGKEPVPPQLPPNPVTMNDTDWVLLGRQMGGKCVFYLEGALVLDESLERSVNETKGSVMRETVPNTDWPGEPLVEYEYRPSGPWSPGKVADVGGEAGAVRSMGDLPVAGPMRSLALDLPPGKLVNADTNHAQAAKEQARQSGYTGDACTACGGMNVKRTGTCTVCENCGSSGGCG